MKKAASSIFLQGMRDGVPIGCGYLAVAFSLGIAARNAGLTPVQGFFASLFTIASAGENAGFIVIAEQSGLVMMALMILVANCRYILMSCALSQRVDPELGTGHRLMVGALITDEIFAASIARKGYLEPAYTYGLATSSVLPWATGTCLGIVMGNLLPVKLVQALAVSLYGMFIAIIIPPARKDRVVFSLVGISFLFSFLCANIPGIKQISGGVRVLVLTVVIAGAAAVLFPVKEENQDEQ